MRSVKAMLVALAVLPAAISCAAQIKNAATRIVKVQGNCGMCEATIEKAGSLKKTAKTDWSQDTKMATITYDSTKTSQEEILKRIALAGYDSEYFLAPDDVYAGLPGCCQYEREGKARMQTGNKAHDSHAGHEHAQQPSAGGLEPVFTHYFALKDALVRSDGGVASASAKDLLAAIRSVKMEQLPAGEHTAWMKQYNDLLYGTEGIVNAKNMEQQRTRFSVLSTSMYTLAKAANHDAPVYYQYCPMANEGKGANWLSREQEIRNPYYGSSMLTCGRVQETISNKEQQR